MKNKRILLIIGHPRSGKTTLANMVADKIGADMVSMDVFARTFGQVFPDIGMQREPDKIEPMFANFLFTYLDNMSDEFPNRKFVVEGCHISPKTAAELLDKSKYKIVVLGCASIAPEQFANNIRKNDDINAWTVKKDDAELKQIAECFINIGKNAAADCEKYGIQFIDTSSDRESKFSEFIQTL